MTHTLKTVILGLALAFAGDVAIAGEEIYPGVESTGPLNLPGMPDFYARERDQKIKAQEAARVKAENDKIAAEQLAERQTHRDPSDVVAQVLNYTSFGDDQGTKDSFWWKLSDCVYTKGGSSYFDAALGVTSGSRLDLNKLDPKSLTIGFDVAPNGDAAPVSYFAVKNEGHNLLVNFFATVDQERATRGWQLIYSDYCKGSVKPF